MFTVLLQAITSHGIIYTRLGVVVWLGMQLKAYQTVYLKYVLFIVRE